MKVPGIEFKWAVGHKFVFCCCFLFFLKKLISWPPWFVKPIFLCHWPWQCWCPGIYKMSNLLKDKKKFSQRVVHIRHSTCYDQEPMDYCYQTVVLNEPTSISPTQDLSSSSISVLFCFPLLGQSWNIHSFKIKWSLR